MKKLEKPGSTCINKKRDPIAKISFLWYQLESNQRHKDFQSFALPTELWLKANFLPIYIKVRR